MSASSAEASRAADAIRESPYVGLTAYAEDDCDFFFGRERDIGVVRGNLQGARLTLFYGESGVGKSSVLLAGVVGRMRAEVAENALVLDEEFDGEAPFAVAVFRSWVDPPVEPLMEAIRTAASAALDGRELEPWSPETSPIKTLREWTRDIRTIYVVLDQFEEYFLYSEKDAGPVTFADTFPRIVNDVAVPVHFVISMREDALAKLDRFKDVLPIYSNALRLDYLDESDARKAIEGPLDRYTELYGNGARFRADPELVDEVIRQIRIGRTHIGDSATAQVEATDGRPGPIGTPLLQLVLTRLWEEERSLGSHVLRLETLQDRLHGTEEIVRTQLDRTLEDLTDDERRLAARSFRYLVTPSGSKIAHFAEDLAKYIGAPEDELRGVLAKLDKASIVRTIEPPPDQKGASSRYEIAHDVLGPAVVEWATREQHETELREHAEEEAERQRTRFARRLATVLTVSTAAAVALAIVAFLARNEAASERDDAQANALGAQALAQIASDPPEALATAIEAVEVARTGTSETALRAALAQPHVVADASHERGVTSASFSSDGRFVATVSVDGTARLSDPRTGKLIRIFDRGVNGVDLSGDGRLLATAGKDGTARIWDVRTGDPVRTLPRRDGALNGLAFSSDGRRLVTAGQNGTARIWNVRTGASVLDLARPDAAVKDVAFSRDGRRIATAGDDGEARLWDAGTGRELHLLDHGGNTVSGVAFSSDGLFVVTTSWSNSIPAQVWDVESGEPDGAPLTHQATVHGAGFAPDAPLVVTASDASAGRIWDVTTGQPVAALVGHTGPVLSAEFSRDGRFVVTASADRTARIWAADANPSLPAFRKHSGDVTSLAFSPDSRRLVTAEDGAARLWDARTGRSIHAFPNEGSTVNGVAFSPDGRLVATAHEDGNTRLWNARTRKPDSVLERHAEAVNAVAFSADGKLVATASWDKTVRVSNLETKEVDDLGAHGKGINGVAFSPDGKLLASASDDRTARLWNLQTGDFRILPRHTGRVTGVAFSPNGRLVATASSDATARIWDARTGAGIRALRGHAGSVNGVAFSPDGNLVVTASADNTARLWDVRTGTTVAVVQRHREPLKSVVFGRGGMVIATASADGVRIHACGVCSSIDVLLEQADALVAHSGTRR